MAFNRHSASACTLVVAGGLLAMVGPGPVSQRWEANLAGENAGQRQAKASQRIYFRNKAGALDWLRDLAGALARGEAADPDPPTLAKACAALDAATIEDFLNNRELWPEFPVSEEYQWCWICLIPLRTALLEQLALVDLPRGLRAFPEEVGTLLRSAARRDGAAALEDWLACRDEWRANPNLFMPVHGAIYAKVPLPTGPERRDAETEVIAAFFEGWGQSAPEKAWTTAVERHWLAGNTLGGLVKGLSPDSDWPRWADRFEAVEWGKVYYGHTSSDSDGYLLLAEKWVRDDPDAAIAWYRGWRRGGADPPLLPTDQFTGDVLWGARRVSGEALLLADWIGAQAPLALQWIEQNPPPDHMLGEIVQGTLLEDAPQMKLLGMIEEPEIRGRVAVGIACISAVKSRLDRDDSRFTEIMNSLYALEGLEDDARAKLAEITVKGLKLDE